MAQETIGLKIEIGGQQKVLTSIGDIKKELKKAEEQAKLFALAGVEGAEQFQNYASVVKELKDAIEDSTNAVTQFSGEQKLDAVIGSAQGIAGAFTAVQGALGAVGIESEAVQSTLLKVQSALAITQGLQSIQVGVKAFSDLGKIIQATTTYQRAYNFVMYGTITATKAADTATKATATSMRILRGVMAGLGIGLLVTGVIALINKISDWTSSTESAKEANDRLNNTLEEQNKILDKNRQKLDQAREDAIMDAKIKGKSAGEIYNINKDFNKKTIEQEQQNYNTKKALLDDYEKKNLESYVENGKRRVRGSEQQIEQYKKLQKEFEDADNALRTKQREDYKTDQEERLRIAEDGRTKSKESNDKAKALRDKEREQQKKDREEAIQAENEAAKNIQILQDEIFLQSIKDETQRALIKLSQDREKEEIRIKENKATAKQKSEELLLIEKKFQQDKDAIELEAATRRKEQEQKDADEAAIKLKSRIDLENQIRIAGIADEFQRKRAELQSQKEKEEEELAKQRADNYFSEEVYQQGLLNIKTKYAKLDADLVKENEEKKKKLREDNINLALDVTKTGLSNITNVVGRETAAGKALSVASATIDTYQAANKALNANYTVFGPAAQVARFASVAATIAVGLKNVREIVKAKVPGGGGGNTANIPSPAPLAPSLPVQTTMTQLDQGTINRLGSATNRAYVVETDITNSQERIRRINRAARLN